MKEVNKVFEAYENETFALKLERDVILVDGPDAGKYLQGQLTQDVLGMKEGESVWSFLLNPDGKVNAWLRVSQISENQYLLDVDSDSGEAVTERLLRFKLRTDCELTLEKWNGVTIVGKDASSCAGNLSLRQIVAETAWHKISSVDIIGGDIEALLQKFPEPKQSSDFLRIINVIPKMGTELHAKVIPAETGLVEKSVSFTKGCYTGQELVARVDSRKGGTPYRLVKISGASDVAADQRYISQNDEKIGTVTSQVVTGDGFFALGFLKRGVESPTEAQVINDDLEEKNVLVMPL